MPSFVAKPSGNWLTRRVGQIRDAQRSERGPFGLRWDLIRYLCVGVINTLVGLSTIYLCMYAFHLGDLQANLIGYCVGVVCSFLLNRRWTFASNDRVIPQLVKFLLVLLVAYGVNVATVLALTHWWGVNHYLAQALGTFPYTAVGYLGSRFIAFRGPAAAGTTR